MTTTVTAALAKALATEPGRPLVTYYDGSTGERIELSVATFDNWVNKIANLFSDELMLEPGEGVYVDLPLHWQATVTLVAAWTAGLVTVLPGAPGDVALSVVGPAAVADSARISGPVVACALRPLGGRFTEPLPDGWLDFALEVPSQPDLLLSPGAAGPDDLALDAAIGRLSHAELAQRGAAAVQEIGLTPGGRLITNAAARDTAGLVASLVGPIVVGASVVLVAGESIDGRARIAEQERATCSWWPAG